MPTLSTAKPARKTLPTEGAVLRAEIAESLARLREQVRAVPKGVLGKKAARTFKDYMSLIAADLAK